MSKPTRVRTSPVLRGSAAAGISSASVLANTLDGVTAEQRKPMTASARLVAERAAALQQGYEQGLAQARSEVEAAMDDANKRVHRALAALCEAVDSFDQRQSVALMDVEDAIAASALAIASAVLQREITVSVDPGADAIARAMKLLPARGEVIARLNPDDAATLSMETVSTSTRSVRVVADPSVEVGGCIAEVGELRIDAQISSALDKVRTALRLTPDLPIEQVAPLPMEYLSQVQSEAIAGSDAPSSRKTASEAPTA